MRETTDLPNHILGSGSGEEISSEMQSFTDEVNRLCSLSFVSDKAGESHYVRARHMSSSERISIHNTQAEECRDADLDDLFGLSHAVSNMYLLSPPTQPAFERVVTQQHWARITQSPATSFLSRFSPSEEMLNTWSYVFDDDMNIRDNSMIKGKYIIGRIICQGAITESREGIPTTANGFQNPVVLKIVKFLPGTESAHKLCRLFTKEISIWKSLDHPNILPLQDLQTFPGMIIAVSPMASKGDLLRLIQRNGGADIPISIIKKIMHQVAKALYYLHVEKRIIHRDVKLENILIHSFDQVYLCDFGLSELILRPEFYEKKPGPLCHICIRVNETFPSSSFSCLCSCNRCAPQKKPATDDACQAKQESGSAAHCTGSLWYCPPEELLPELKSQISDCYCERVLNGPKADIWAFGVCLYALVKGKYPFMDEFIPRLQMKVKAGVYEPITYLPDVDERSLADLNQILECSLCVDRYKRWDIKQAISSAFFRDFSTS
ncbi:hypothetical protein MDAP_001831 [Mitosporidium daphniae]|uniref:non-specific serine/threonine protein kinase n=1 Tax=Mitosporidium daphniae TaxID=1485682 RepID=A0A098VSL0_9MICR|nr:putative protein kinase [Mitosporidium daphniae]KGG51967.1 putative protein kinase [Mitosporidium daphniae]|eukprot:XP_013238403.1 putative protein kinase [Mitosporidium daphniae]